MLRISASRDMKGSGARYPGRIARHLEGRISPVGQWV